jgi:chorismate synthase
MARRSAASSTACRPGIALTAEMIQGFLDKRRPGQGKFVTQRQEPDAVRILSGVFEDARTGGQRTTGTPISLMIENTDQRSKDYGEIAQAFRPGHADYPYFAKYGVRDYRGGGRSSARETAARVAAGAVARLVIPGVTMRAALVQIGPHAIDRDNWDWDQTNENPYWSPDAAIIPVWEEHLEKIRKAGSSTGAIVEVEATGVPAGWGAPLYGKLDAELAAALMSINAAKGVEIGEGFASAALTGEDNADQMRMGNDGPGVPVQPRRRRVGRPVDRPAGGGARGLQADLVDPDPAPDGQRGRRRDRPAHQGPPRSVRRHSRRAGGRGHDRLRAGRRLPAPPRPDRRRRLTALAGRQLLGPFGQRTRRMA